MSPSWKYTWHLVWEVIKFPLAVSIVLSLIVGSVIWVQNRHKPDPATSQGPSVDGLQLRYFRDDVHQTCYAYFHGRPESLVVIDCNKGYWH